MLIHVNGAKCIGIDAVRVMVEIEIGKGVGIHLVGLADIAVKESLLRTTTALQSLGYRIPGKQIVINLAPADLHKKGSGYDLPIAMGIIAASGQAELPEIGEFIIMGELGLDGSVRNINGALPITELAINSGMKGVILPEESAMEAMEFKDTKVFGAKNLKDVVRIVTDSSACDDLLIWNTKTFKKMERQRHHAAKTEKAMDFADIIGQEGAKRAMEIAAAGGHNIILIGAPGSGKSSLAKALASILPPMTREESLTTSKIYSIAGKGGQRYALMRERPFRSPHYSASLSAIIGGGGGDGIVPGEITLAQNGVLFLDEAGQMPRSVIEALRGPIEDRKVTISRLKTKMEYPASFMLVAASNPCPCGYYGEGDRCTCTPTQRINYLGKLSGPIMDRIDLQCWMRSVDTEKVLNGKKAEPSSEVAKRVLKARIAQKQRFAAENLAAGQTNIMTNSEMNNRQIEKYCPLSEACMECMKKLMKNSGLSMRAYFRIIRVARTIADLEGSDEIRTNHLLEAANYRFLDKSPK